MNRFVHRPALRVPAGFAGWWCEHCDKPAPGIPDELDAARARCPRCHKWTAVYVPGSPLTPALSPEGEREETRPVSRAHRGAQWFALMRARVDGLTAAQTPEEYEHELVTR